MTEAAKHCDRSNDNLESNEEASDSSNIKTEYLYDGKVLFRMPQYPDLCTVEGDPCTVMEGLHADTVHAVCLRHTIMWRRKCSSKDLGNRSTEGKRYIPVQQGPSDVTHVPDQPL